MNFDEALRAAFNQSRETFVRELWNENGENPTEGQIRQCLVTRLRVKMLDRLIYAIMCYYRRKGHRLISICGIHYYEDEQLELIDKAVAEFPQDPISIWWTTGGREHILWYRYVDGENKGTLNEIIDLLRWMNNVVITYKGAVDEGRDGDYMAEYAVDLIDKWFNAMEKLK